MNAHWLAYFDVDKSCLLDPVKEPLPFSPFRGELIIKDNTMSELGLGGKKYKKMKVTRLI